MIDLNSTSAATCAVATALERVRAPLGAGGIYLKVADALRSGTPKTASDLGFGFVKYEPDLDLRTRDTIWWASQACKKHLALTSDSANDQIQMSKDAIAGFLDRNEKVKDAHIWWPLRDLVARRLRDALPEVSPETIQGRFGPGACFEGLDGFQKWNLFEVCDFDPQQPSLVPREETEAYGFLCPTRYLPGLGGDRVARLTAVPKDNWRMRLISVEPGRNSFLQQFVRSLLLESVHRGCLRGTPSDFLSKRDNVESQRLRCISASRHLRTSTIDLKDASDYINADDVFCLFPSWVIPWLEMSRTPYVLDPYTGIEHKLWMYGGMGNATTFLVETLLFWATFEAIGEYLRINARVSAFGDDVILSSDVAAHPLFKPLAERCGFVLNRDKSCIGRDTLMREACGIVAYDGHVLTRLVRVSAPGFGIRGRIGLCDLANHLVLTDLPIHAVFRDEILSGYDGPTIFARPSQQFSSFGRELTWSDSSIGHLLVPGDPTANACADVVPDYSLQRLVLRTVGLTGRKRVYTRHHLQGWEAMAVIAGQVHTQTRTGSRNKRCKTVVEVPMHMQTCVKRRRVLL